MAFDPNKQLQLAAEETSPGRYLLRTKGLVALRRPELEMIAVPEPALTAAGSVLNLVASYCIDKAEIFADQTVGNVLAVKGEDRELLLVVRTVEATPPAKGLWVKLTGTGKGVLRLVDPDEGSQTPLMALATMLVHRATLRRAKDDAAGARTELLAAIEAFPGEADQGKPPVIEGANGLVNWQNYLAYLDLARVTEDEGEAARHHASAAARNPALSVERA
jgi:hypothetical protein